MGCQFGGMHTYLGSGNALRWIGWGVGHEGEERGGTCMPLVCQREECNTCMPCRLSSRWRAWCLRRPHRRWAA